MPFQPISLRAILVLFSYLYLGLQSSLLPSCFPTKFLHAFLFSPICAMCMALSSLIWSSKWYSLRSISHEPPHYAFDAEKHWWVTQQLINLLHAVIHFLTLSHIHICVHSDCCTFTHSWYPSELLMLWCVLYKGAGYNNNATADEGSELCWRFSYWNQCLLTGASALIWSSLHHSHTYTHTISSFRNVGSSVWRWQF